MACILQIFFKPQREVIFHNLVKGQRLGVWSHKDVVSSTPSVNQIGVHFLLHPPLQLLGSAEAEVFPARCFS